MEIMHCFFFFLVVKGQYYIFEVRASISKITIAHQGTRMCSASEVSVLSCVLVSILSGLSLEVALSCDDHGAVSWSAQVL